MSNPNQIWICSKPGCGCVAREQDLITLGEATFSTTRQCPQCKGTNLAQSPDLECPGCKKTFFSEPQMADSEWGEWHTVDEECPHCRNSGTFDRFSAKQGPENKCPHLVLRTHPAITFPKNETQP